MKTNLIFKVVFLALMIINARSYSQEVHGGLPLTWQLNTTNPDLPEYVDIPPDINTYTMPDYVNAVLQARVDSINNVCEKCPDISYYGKIIPKTINIITDGTYQEINGMKVYRYKVSSNLAIAIQFYFSKFKLPEEGALFFYNADRSKLFGSLTYENNPLTEEEGMKLVTVPLTGNEWILEYNEPIDLATVTELELGDVVHVFNSVASGVDWSDCQIDAECSLGDGWDTEKKSTMLIAIGFLNGYTGSCSGNLINTQANSEAYGLSAGHCFKDENGSNADVYMPGTIQFIYNYKWNICTDNSTHSYYSTLNSSYGCTIKSAKYDAVNLDYALLQVSSSVQTLRNWNLCWAGWDRSSSLNNQYPYTMFHHPHGYEMKICQTQYSDPVSIFDPENSATPNPSGGFYETIWGQGITQPGSSGAGLFNNNHKLIGMLWGGGSECIDNNGPAYNGVPDYVSKFSKAYADGGFGFWLDPNNTGAMTCNSFCSPANPGNPGNPGQGNGNQTVVFNVNGKVTPNNGVVQVCANNVVLTPAGSWMYINTGVNKYCMNINNLSQAAIWQQNCGACKCQAIFLQLFISIQECDYNLNLIPGTEHMQWFNIYDGSHVTLDEDDNFFPIDLANYQPQGFVMQDGKYYNIKVATVNQNTVPHLWTQHTVMVKTLAQNLTINNQTIKTSQAAISNLEINNSTVQNSNPPVKIVAGTSIKVTPESKLGYGKYYLNTVDCSYLTQLRTYPQTTGGKGGDGNNSYSSYNAEGNNVKLNGSKNSVSVFPNPSSADFNITVSLVKEANVSATVMDINGRAVLNCFNYQNIDGNLKYSINAKELSSGIYFLILKIDNEDYRYKLIKSVQD